MTSPVDRRRFLRLAAVTVVAHVPLLAGCSSPDDATDNPVPLATPPSSAPADSDRVFPQGVASGDPMPDSVVLWARAEGTGSSVEIAYVVATDEALTHIVASGTVATTAEADFTIKLRVKGLSPYTRYYYRFSANGITSRTARTKTAPASGQDVPVRFAFASCQDFVGRYYHAWRALNESPEGNDIDFVVFLGDYIYETTGDPSFQSSGATRSISLPDGIALGDANAAYKSALTLADYRALYRQYRSDPNLRRAHELFPFVTIWDDHEFANDCWQDHSTDYAGAKDADTNYEANPARRHAASRAWFEYQPADVPFDASAAQPNDITIYRTLRFGKHVDLVLTDQRLYRDKHVIDEGPADFSVAKVGENSALGAHYFVLKSGFDTKEAAAMPSMLGSKQRAWFLDTMRASQATWKVWGNEVQLWQMLIDLASFPSVPDVYRKTFYATVDQWDGYRTERAAILRELSGVSNLVAVTGDIHAFYASELFPDFDNPTGEPVAAEFVTAGISSESNQEGIRLTIERSPTFSALGLAELVPQLDAVLLQTNASHLRYAKSESNGIAVVEARADAFEVTFLAVSGVTNEMWDGTAARTTLRCRAGSSRIEV